VFPLGLKVLLGEAENSPVRKTSQHPESQASIADWLDFNGLTRETTLRLLALIEPADFVTDDEPKLQLHLDLTADEAWTLCADSMRVAFPNLKPEIEKIEAKTPKCLQPKGIKHPEPFTYDLGFPNLPFVSQHYSGRAKDLLMMAHEFGHAVQIVASWMSGEGQMPPVVRECCAFIAEQALLDVGPGNSDALLAGHRADSAVYFGKNRRALYQALEDASTPYQYEWNYLLARMMAAHLWEKKGREGMTELFRAGRDGGAVFANVIYQELEAA
jgi:hypothetical protein